MYPKKFWKLCVFFLVTATCACSGVQPNSSTENSSEQTPLLSPRVTQLTDLDRQFTDSDLLQGQRQELVDRYIAPVVSDERVLAAMRTVPRHSFIPIDHIQAAYGDFPLPIGYGQTISQPSLVAMMTQQLQLEAGDRVLEIGTGSGYQAAILRELTDEVYSVEIIPELTQIARSVLDHLGYEDIHLSRHDGYLGWEAYAPYDAIIVTAAPDHLPPSLTAQLSPNGGRLVIPIGPVGDVQTLWLVTREGEAVDMTRLLDVRFVPLTRGESQTQRGNRALRRASAPG